jgi:D-alanyl-D-alanine carboxypeptidase
VILQAVDDGVLDLDSKIGKWIGTWPGFERLPNAKDLTLRLLMSHRTGINDYVLDKEFAAVLTQDPARNWTAQELAGFLFGQKPLSEAGTAFAYADANFVVAGLVYETATGRKLFSDVERRVLKPLALAHTVTSESRDLKDLVAGKLNPRTPFGLDGYTLRDGKLVLNAQSEYAGGGMISTSGDLARWAKLLWEGKAFSAKQLQQALDAKPTGVGRGGGRDAKYGLAVQVQPSEFGTVYAHAGWFPGYQTEMVYFPDHKIAIAMQTNQDPGLGAKKSLRACLMELAGLVLKN